MNKWYFLEKKFCYSQVYEKKGVNRWVVRFFFVPLQTEINFNLNIMIYVKD